LHFAVNKFSIVTEGYLIGTSDHNTYCTH